MPNECYLVHSRFDPNSLHYSDLWSFVAVCATLCANFDGSSALLFAKYVLEKPLHKADFVRCNVLRHDKRLASFAITYWLAPTDNTVWLYQNDAKLHGLPDSDKGEQAHIVFVPNENALAWDHVRAEDEKEVPFSHSDEARLLHRTTIRVALVRAPTKAELLSQQAVREHRIARCKQKLRQLRGNLLVGIEIFPSTSRRFSEKDWTLCAKDKRAFVEKCCVLVWFRDVFWCYATEWLFHISWLPFQSYLSPDSVVADRIPRKQEAIVCNHLSNLRVAQLLPRDRLSKHYNIRCSEWQKIATIVSLPCCDWCYKLWRHTKAEDRIDASTYGEDRR